MDKEAAKGLLQELLPDADVRIDQCDVIRIFWQRRAAFLRHTDDRGIELRILLTGEPNAPDFLTGPSIVDYGLDERDAIAKLSKWLRKVVEVGW